MVYLFPLMLPLSWSLLLCHSFPHRLFSGPRIIPDEKNGKPAADASATKAPFVLESYLPNEVVASCEPALFSSASLDPRTSSTFSPLLNYDTRWMARARLCRSQTFDGPSFSHSCRVSHPMLFKEDAGMQDEKGKPPLSPLPTG